MQFSKLSNNTNKLFILTTRQKCVYVPAYRDSCCTVTRSLFGLLKYFASLLLGDCKITTIHHIPPHEMLYKILPDLLSLPARVEEKGWIVKLGLRVRARTSKSFADLEKFRYHLHQVPTINTSLKTFSVDTNLH